MIVASSRAELDQTLRGALTDGVVRALVPTMGALHEGHGSLLDCARERADTVVASVFVNPLQFGPGEDLDSYPRTLEDDLDLCAAHGVDVVFTPRVETLYPSGRPLVTVDPGPVADELEGRARPGHFQGVLIVVAKLFGLVRPDVAVFGQKDYQQLVLIQQMVRDLCLLVEVVGADTVRDADGLALSSRNRFLDPAQRAAALGLSRALFAGRAAEDAGVDGILKSARPELDAVPGVAVDYLTVRAPDLGPAPASGPARLLVAATLGSVRLIDNVAVCVPGVERGRSW